MRIKRKITYYINPGFLEIHSIFESIKYLLNKYRYDLQNKKLLDIGCGSKPYLSLFKQINIEYKGIDFRSYSNNYSYELNKPDYYFKKTYDKDYKLTQFENDSYDIITAFQILEHHEKPEIFFPEVKRILRKGGFLIISFPFIWELHEEPNDFQRLTHYKIKQLCQENHLEVKEMIKRGSSLSVISQLINLSFLNLRTPLIKDLLYFILLLPLQFFSYIYDKISKNPRKTIFLGYTFLIKNRD